MIVTAVRRLAWLATFVVLSCITWAQLAAPKAQAAVTQHATLTAVTKPAFNPACIVNLGPLSSVLCNKVVSGAISKGVATVVGGAVKQAAGSAVNAALGSIGSSFFGGIAQALNAASIYILGLVGKFMGAVQTPNLQAAWFFSIYDKIMALSFLLLSIMMVGAILFALVTWSAARLFAAFKAMFVAILVAFGMPFVLQVMLLFSDSIATAISGGSKSGIGFTGALQNLVTQMSGDSGVPVWISIAVMVFVWTAAFILYLELLVRSVVIYAGLLFAPMAFTTRVMGQWGQRVSSTLMRFLLAVIFSVPLMVALLLLGAAVMSHVPNVPGLEVAKPLIAAVTLFLALLSPIAVQSWARQISVAVSDAREERARASGSASNIEPDTGPQRSRTQLAEMAGTTAVAGAIGGADASSRTGRVIDAVAPVLAHPATKVVATAAFGPEAGAALAVVGTAASARPAKATSARPVPAAKD